MEAIYDQAEVLAQVYTEVQKRFKQFVDLAHGWEHISRVYQTALYLAEREGADSFVVGMAALMHDLGHTIAADEAESKRHHVDHSLTLASEIMQAHAIPDNQQKAILHAILAHSFSRGIKAETVEAYVVQDADRLDALGALGIMRWAVTGAQLATAEAQPYEPEDPFGEHHTLDDRRYMLDHFFSKLLRIGETMKTETGRQLAQSRTEFMRLYLHEFKQELELTR
ncbi:HD domain-containing protein [Tengunoibacter tsumagoiensis]|uniref:Phosphohydrolase n=1 Tax=Tengunoibacter tsumagoiensis TaxID=2014871 RepID=A0A401ZUZ5_9CHLR|nr:HD domain-containing protein [Tengunoibacter tsumagoiensis]GCE10544.1 phosphohydrolase [Tengunoibacter tsumagoiensis]